MQYFPTYKVHIETLQKLKQNFMPLAESNCEKSNRPEQCFRVQMRISHRGLNTTEYSIALSGEQDEPNFTPRVSQNFSCSEVLLSELEAELVTLVAQRAGELWRSAEEDGHLALLLLLDLAEHLVPVGPAGDRARLQARDHVTLLLGG